MIIFLFVVALFLLVVLMKSIKIVPQKQVKIIERLGKYHGTAEAGLNVILPFDEVISALGLRGERRLANSSTTMAAPPASE